MRSAHASAPRTIEIRQCPQPTAGIGEVIVRVRNCGICGSDLHFFSGDFPPPAACLGHEIAGEVAAVGSAVRNLREGDRVAVEPLAVCGQCPSCRTGNYQLCPSLEVIGHARDGGFADSVRVPASSCFVLPDGVDFELGSLAEPLAVAVHAIRLRPLELGDRVLVLGAGTIGLMSIAAARAAGAGEIWVTARHPQQVEMARTLGATRVFSGPSADADLSRAASLNPVDEVVETIGGHADTINDALHLVRPGGQIVVLGIFSSLPTINAMALVVKEARLMGSMTYGRSGVRADFDRALSMLAEQPDPFRRLITHRFELDSIQAAFTAASDKKSGSIKVTVTT